MSQESDKLLMVAACPFPANRGTPSRILRMSESLLKYYEVDVLTYPVKENIEVDKDLHIERIEPPFSYSTTSPGPNLKKPILDLFMVYKLRKLHKQKEYDLIYLHHYEGSLIGWLSGKTMCGMPETVYDAHSSLVKELNQFGFFSNNITQPIWKKVEEFLSTRHEKIVCVSQQMENYLETQKYLENKESIVIPTGIRLDNFKSMITGEDSFKDDDEIRIVYTGSVAPYQNLEQLPEIIKYFKENSTEEFTFHIITSETEQNENIKAIKKKAEKKEVKGDLRVKTSVEFKQIPDYLDNSDILINLRTECSGIPQKLINYMAVGKPIITYRGSSQILENQETCIKVEDRNLKEFSKMLDNLASNLKMRSKLSENSKKEAEKYDWENLAEKLEVFLKK